MTVLRTRKPRFDWRVRRQQPALKGFHAPQRDREPVASYPKPRCGMCGGKVHTRSDFTTGDGWWLCPPCDPGPEVGL